MKYSLRNTEELQQMQDRLLRMQESITLLQKMIADQESGLELLAIHKVTIYMLAQICCNYLWFCYLLPIFVYFT